MIWPLHAQGQMAAIARLGYFANLPGWTYIAAADNRIAVVSTSTGRLWVLDYANGKLVQELDNLTTRGEAAAHDGVKFSPDGKNVCDRYCRGQAGNL